MIKNYTLAEKEAKPSYRELEAQVKQLSEHLKSSQDDATCYKQDFQLSVKRTEQLAAENAALKTSSAYVMQDGEPPTNFYREEWFIAKVKGHGFAVVKSLPEEYSYDYTTLDATYFRKDLITQWMQLPSTEFLPNVETPATDAILASLRAEAIEFAAYHLPSNGKYEDMLLTLADEVREGLTEVKIPAPKYQRCQSEQVKGVQS